MTVSSFTAPTDLEARNIAIVRRLMDEGFCQGNLAVCDEVFSPDSVEHQRGNPPGAEGAKKVITTLRTWFSDFRLEIEDIIARDDMVWFRNRATGVNTGSVMGFPPTGRTVELTVFDVVRFADGKVVEHWGVPDQLGLLLQLGLFTPPGRPQH